MQISDKIKMISVEEYCERISPLHFRIKNKNPYQKISRQAVYYRIANNRKTYSYSIYYSLFTKKIQNNLKKL